MKDKDKTKEQLIDELAALRKKEEHFDFALAASQVGLWEWNIQTGELYMSPYYEKLLGYQDNEIDHTIEKWESMLHPEDKKPALDLLRNYLDEPGGGTLEGKFRMRIKKGEYHWFSSRGQAFWNQEGKAIRMLGSMRDITDLKNLEVELKESQEKLKEKVARCANELTSAKTKLGETGEFLENIINSSLDSIAVVDKKVGGLVVEVDVAVFVSLEDENKAAADFQSHSDWHRLLIHQDVLMVHIRESLEQRLALGDAFCFVSSFTS